MLSAFALRLNPENCIGYCVTLKPARAALIVISSGSTKL
jgi:hypothetical protein